MEMIEKMLREKEAAVISRLKQESFERLNPGLTGEGNASSKLTLIICRLWAREIVSEMETKCLVAALLDIQTTPYSLGETKEAVENFLKRYYRLEDVCAPIGSGRQQANDCGGRVAVAWRREVAEKLVERGVLDSWQAEQIALPQKYGRQEEMIVSTFCV